MDIWYLFSLLYISVAILTFIPTLLAILKKVELHPGGSSFHESTHFSDETKQSLEQHYTRIMGTLVFWKNQAEKYRRFHYYCLCWTIPASILIPILTQYISQDVYSKMLLTIISTHTAVLLAFHRGFKVDRNFRSFRHGESEFYDTYRRLLDRPLTFGLNEKEQIDKYFSDVETIRKFVRNAETDNLPTVDDVKVESNHVK